MMKFEGPEKRSSKWPEGVEIYRPEETITIRTDWGAEIKLEVIAETDERYICRYRSSIDPVYHDQEVELVTVEKNSPAIVSQ